MSDEKNYLLATKEIETDEKDEALWAKALALTEGDAEKAKYKYINLRAVSLAEVTPATTETGTPTNEAVEDGDWLVKEGLKDFLETGTSSDEENFEDQADDIGFKWWNTWAWMGLSIFNTLLASVIFIAEGGIWTVIIPSINTLFMLFVLGYNKYAFLITTIFSLNPIFWIINGIYLKNRWHHPRINKLSEL